MWWQDAPCCHREDPAWAAAPAAENLAESGSENSWAYRTHTSGPGHGKKTEEKRSQSDCIAVNAHSKCSCGKCFGRSLICNKCRALSWVNVMFSDSPGGPGTPGGPWNTRKTHILGTRYKYNIGINTLYVDKYKTATDWWEGTKRRKKSEDIANQTLCSTACVKSQNTGLNLCRIKPRHTL